MDIKEAAQFYIDKGWQVVPLSKGSKACTDPDWMELIFTSDMFREGENIGLRSVEGLVVIDIDSIEAVSFADKFLPKTECVFGRRSKPRSKRLYFCKEITKIEAYNDLSGGGMLVEIRVNHQDMCPPSIHPNGEEIVWDSNFGGGNLAIVDSETLRRSVRLLATIALMARHYPPSGNRHEWGLALAGSLRQFGLTEDEAIACFNFSGAYANDGDVNDRLNAVKGTYAHASDEPLKAHGALKELAGLDFSKSLNKIWGVKELERSEIERLNEIHALIHQQNGELVLITEKEDGNLRFSPPTIMPMLYPRPITYDFTNSGLPKQKKLGTLWLESSKRRFYDGIDLAPDGKLPLTYYNLWKGFSVEPKKGSWDLYKKHIREVITSDDEELYNYILAWMANTVQHPEKQGYTAIVLRGDQGIGKSTFAEWFGSLFGPHFLELSSSSQLTGRFNAHFHNAIFVFADEAAWPGDRSGIGALRRMITQDTLSIERKGLDILMVKNRMHLMIASNENWVVHTRIDDRRFAAMDMSDKRRNDFKWFGAIHKELFEQGGLAAMLHDLLEWKMDVNLRIVPNTETLSEQKIETLDYLQTWWFEKLRTGNLYEGDWPEKIPADSLHENYIEQTDIHYRVQRKRKATQTELGLFLRKYAPNKKQQEMFDGIKTYYRYFPSLEACRGIWTEITGIGFEKVE